MTALLIQTLEIPDCEAALERGYFDWGRGRSADSPEPDWDHASPDQRRAIAMRGYGLYDGWPVQSGNEVGATEVYVSLGVNSNVLLYDVIRFLVRADRARPLLDSIPDDVRLEDASDGIVRAAGELIDLFTGAYQIDRGKATKVLYKKRPALIPVIDSVVFDFLWRNFPHVVREGSSGAEVLSVYRDILLARARPLGAVHTAMAALGFPLSTARILSYLVWHHWRGRTRRTLRAVWEASSVPAARAKARESWSRQRAGTE